MNVRALKLALKVAEVPSFEAPRVHGVGRLQTIPDGWRVLKTIVRERLFVRTPKHPAVAHVWREEPLPQPAPIQLRRRASDYPQLGLTVAD